MPIKFNYPRLNIKTQFVLMIFIQYLHSLIHTNKPSTLHLSNHAIPKYLLHASFSSDWTTETRTTETGFISKYEVQLVAFGLKGKNVLNSFRSVTYPAE